MKRLLTIFLVLALMSSLFGCAKQQQPDDSPKRISTSTAVFVDQACRLAQVVAVSTDPGYLRALEAPAEVIAAADSFFEAITKEPEQVKLLTTKNGDLAKEITELCSRYNGADAVACCSILNVNTQIYLQSPPSKTAAVYLRYSDKCHMVAIFTPLGTHTVSVTVYPMFYETAEALLKSHFADAQDLTEDEILQSRKKAESVPITAEYTDSTVSKLYYFKLASRALTETQPIDPARIREYTEDPEVIHLVEQFAQVVINEPSDIAVFHFPSRVAQQARDILKQTQYAEVLTDATNRRVYLSWLNEISLRHGTQYLVANALLAALANSRPIGTVANNTVEPALAVLRFSDEITLIMSIYPGEHNLYDYSYICVPVSYEEACGLLRSEGAKQFH